MDKEKAMELDKMVFEWWYNNKDVTLADIGRHFSVMSMLIWECAENFEKLLKEKKDK